MKFHIKNIKNMNLVFPEGEDAAASAKKVMDEYKALDNPTKGGLFIPYEIAMQLTVMPQPDPETGLVPCGCGGKAEAWLEGIIHRSYHVKCSKCGIDAPYCETENEAADAWNLARGYLKEEGELKSDSN